MLSVTPATPTSATTNSMLLQWHRTFGSAWMSHEMARAIPDEPSVQKGYCDFFYHEVEEELCKLCESRPATINGMCEYYDFIGWRQKQGDTILCVKWSFTPAGENGLCKDCTPQFNQFYEVGGPSNWLTPWNALEDLNETRYDNHCWYQSPEESVGSCDKESVRSCDWIVISSDNEWRIKDKRKEVRFQYVSLVLRC